MRVLVVDDSVTFRSQIKRALGGIPGVEIVGSASNGRLALQCLEQKAVDLMILDLNMPEMSGLELLAKLEPRSRPGLAVIVFAGRTERSAEETIEALSLGASDFVLKPLGQVLDFESAYLSIAEELLPKVRQFLRAAKAEPQVPRMAETRVAEPRAKPPARVDVEAFHPTIVVIASSTGGPGALEALLRQMSGPLCVPVFLAQHMPETFTRHLAARLTSVTGIPCREAVHGEKPEAGTIYVAPGDYHLRLELAEGQARQVKVALDQGPKVNGVRPAADPLFRSAAQLYGSGCFGMVLTGMGQDGLVGAQAIKAAGGAILIQDEATSVVWGMPGAVHAADLQDQVASIEDCGRILGRIAVSRRAAG